jgi:hypothetical protein
VKSIPLVGGLVGAIALLAAACGSSAKTATPATAPASTASAGGSPTTMMAMPAYAMSYHTSFASPADGVKVTGNELAVSVNVTGYTDSCDWAGKPVQQGVGHYHLLLDKALVNMYCTPSATVSMQNVKPGMHKLTVVPALNDHNEVDENGQTISFDYEPTSPMPQLTDQTFPSPPSIKILSPKSGDTISGPFDVTVQINNFKPSCDLFGKPDVAGYGHWHLNFDTTSGAMNGMGSMGGMSCTATVHTSTVGLTAGQTHSLIAILVDDGHAPLNPAIVDKVDVTIG